MDWKPSASMIVTNAEPGSRRKGIAREAVTMMMAYAAQRLGVMRFRCALPSRVAA